MSQWNGPDLRSVPSIKVSTKAARVWDYLVRCTMICWGGCEARSLARFHRCLGSGGGEGVRAGLGEAGGRPQEEAVSRWHHLVVLRTQMDGRQPHLELRFSYKGVLCPPAQDGASDPTEILLVWISNSLGASKRSGKSQCLEPLPPPSESWPVAAQPPAPRPVLHSILRGGWREERVEERVCKRDYL